MAPEYAIDGIYSTKSDIFSFGVLVLEIVSGKKNRGFHHADHDLNLLGHVSFMPLQQNQFYRIPTMFYVLINCFRASPTRRKKRF